MNRSSILLMGAALVLGCGRPPANGNDAAAADSSVVPRDTRADTLAARSFHGLGQEPGWLLDVVAGQHIHFQYDYAQREVLMPFPSPALHPATGAVVYHAVTDEHDLRVAIADLPCSDAMSGRAFEATATVTLDGREFQGCGSWLD